MEQIIAYSLSAILIVLSGLMFRSYSNTKKHNVKIMETLSRVYDELEGSQKEIAKWQSLKTQFEDTTRLQREVLDNISSGVMVLHASEDGENFYIADINQTAEEISKVQYAEIVGKDLREVFPGIEKQDLYGAIQGVWHSGAAQYVPKYKLERVEGWRDNYLFKLASGEIVNVYNNLTEGELSRNQLYEAQEHLKTVLQSISNGIIVTDINLCITSINNEAMRLTGWTEEEAKGHKLFEVFNIHGVEQTESSLLTLLFSQRTHGLEDDIFLINKKGDEKAISYSAAPLETADHSIRGLVVTFNDITEQKNRINKIEYLSFHDQLTGLKNKAYLDQALQKLDKQDSLPLSIVFADANELKSINDTFGHKAGDEYLKVVARILKNTCRNDDIIVRWGGDEFVVLLPNTTIKATEMYIERVKRIISDHEINGYNVDVAFGASVKQKPSEDIHEIMIVAEEEMYKNKLKDGKERRQDLFTFTGGATGKRGLRTLEEAQQIESLAVQLGSKLGLPEQQLESLSLLSKLLDIGKVVVPEKVIRKPGQLNDEEWQAIKKHTEVGFRITKADDQLAKIANDILSHHEWWNGSGYPRGIKGEEIPLLARIISLVSAYNAMTHARPYKKTLTKEQALSELRRCAATQFDPKLVLVFESIVND